MCWIYTNASDKPQVLICRHGNRKRCLVTSQKINLYLRSCDQSHHRAPCGVAFLLMKQAQLPVERERKIRKEIEEGKEKKKTLLRVTTHPLSLSFSLHLSTRPQVLYCISNRSFLTVINAHQIPLSRSEETQSALMPFTHS